MIPQQRTLVLIGLLEEELGFEGDGEGRGGGGPDNGGVLRAALRDLRSGTNDATLAVASGAGGAVSVGTGSSGSGSIAPTADIEELLSRENRPGVVEAGGSGDGGGGPGPAVVISEDSPPPTVATAE